MTMKEFDNIMQVKLGKGENVTEENNTFIGYTLAIENVQQVRMAYQKLRIKHLEARHIVCSFFLPGKPSHCFRYYCNNNDYGCSQVLLQLLEYHNMINRAVFVVRNAGQKIGAMRYKCIKQAARAAIDAALYKNSLLKKKQEWKVPQKPAQMTKKGTVQSNMHKTFRVGIPTYAAKVRRGRGSAHINRGTFRKMYAPRSTYRHGRERTRSAPEHDNFDDEVVYQFSNPEALSAPFEEWDTESDGTWNTAHL